MEGTHWTGFHIKVKKSFHFDSFEGPPDKFLFKQLPNPIISHKDEVQNSTSIFCGTIYLYFHCLMERTDFYDSVLKINFVLNKCQ